MKKNDSTSKNTTPVSHKKELSSNKKVVSTKEEDSEWENY